MTPSPQLTDLAEVLERAAPYETSGDLTDQHCSDLIQHISACYFWQLFGLQDTPPTGTLPSETKLADLLLAARRLIHREHRSNLELKANPRTDDQGRTIGGTITAIPDPRLLAAAYAAYHYDPGTSEDPQILFARPSPTPGKVIVLCLIEAPIPHS